MQLFILDYAPRRAAGMLCDVHLRKMCLETAQILSGVLFLQGRDPSPGMPKVYNPAHPVIKALDSPQKINWVILYNKALHREYFRRFGRKHAYHFLCPQYRKRLWRDNVKLHKKTLSFARNFKDAEITEPDIVCAYRLYYRCKKRLLRYWNYTKTAEPRWLKF